MFKFALRHMLRHWRMNLVVLGGLIVSIAFLAGLPSYATAIAGRGLQRQIDAAPVSARNISINSSGLNAAVYGDLQALLGDFFVERMTLELGREIGGQSTIFRGAAEIAFDEFLALAPVSIDLAGERLMVVDGRLPTTIPPAPGQRHIEVEAVLGRPAAEFGTITRGQGTTITSTLVQVGDQLRSADEMLRVNIVGIVEPSDPENDIWWGDFSSFSTSRESRNGANQPDTIIFPLYVAPEAMRNALGGGAQFWRIVVDAADINVDNVDTVYAKLSNAQSQLRLNLESGLLTLIDTYRQQLAAAQVTLFLLTLQSLIFVFYTLGMISAFLLEQSRAAVATLAGRGFNSRQITRLFAIQGAILSFLLGLPLGPFLARLTLQVWGGLTDTAVPTTITRQSWLLALAAALFSWLTLVTAVYLGTRGNILDWERQRARPDTRAAWQRYYLDFFLLAIGALVYWQLQDTGTVTAQFMENPALADAGLADPLLLLGPTLLLIAAALLFLRLFPPLLRFGAWLAQSVRGLILPFGLAKLSRDPIGPSRVILLISLAAGLTLFANLFSHSLRTRQAEIAHYQTGADVRVRLPIQAGEEAAEMVAEMPGVELVSPAYVNERVRLARNLGRQAQLLAIDLETFPTVARFAPYISRLQVADVVPALTHFTATGAIPAVFSRDAFPLEKQIGDQIEYVVGTSKVTFEVRGIISNFPALSGGFMISNVDLIDEALPLETYSEPWVGRRELWLNVEPRQHDAFLREMAQGNGPIGSTVVASALQTERTFQANLVAQETLGAFELNAFMLIGLSVGVFLLVHFFSARRRLFEFSLLRAAGMSTRQLLTLLTLEGGIMMGLGLVAGTAVGAGLARIMQPFLSRTLSAALGGEALVRILVNWLQVGGYYALLLAVYGLALLVLLAVLLRSGLHRALRIGDE